MVQYNFLHSFLSFANFPAFGGIMILRDKTRLKYVKFGLANQHAIRDGRAHIVEEKNGQYRFYLYTPAGPRQAVIDDKDGTIQSYVMDSEEWRGATDMVKHIVDGELRRYADDLGYGHRGMGKKGRAKIEKIFMGGRYR